ncbi:hypothetical protein NVP1036O_59 [Vibrio phage 1.036.O._10N.286.45.C3]|nr:hypothetical protein NVP1036O_59 [Vibrio phage 1.036.O._10N.286.45.C3]
MRPRVNKLRSKGDDYEKRPKKTTAKKTPAKKKPVATAKKRTKKKKQTA